MEESIYKQYGDLIKNARKILVLCSTKKERKSIIEGLRECGIDNVTMSKLVSGLYLEEDAQDLYISVLCFYLDTIMQKKDVSRDFWNETIMPYDYAVKIINEVSGTISDYSALLDLLKLYGYSIGKIKVVDNSLLYRQSGIWDIPKKSELRIGLQWLKPKEEETIRRRKTHGKYTQNTRKEYGSIGNPLLIKRK